MARGQSFELAMEMADAFAALSPEAQRIVKLLAQVPPKMKDARARAEVRTFLSQCERSGIEMVGVERARAVLAAFEGEIGGEGEAVRLVG